MKILHVIPALGMGGAEKLLVDTVTICNSSGMGMEILLLNGSGTPFFEKLRHRNIAVSCLCKGNIKNVYNPLHIFRLIPYLRRYDIIHVHLFPALYWVAFAKIVSFSNINLIYTEHSTHNKRRNYKCLQPVESFIYKQYSKIICISKQTQEHLSGWIKSTGTGTRMQVIHNGIDIASYETAEAIDKTALGLPENARFILMIARFHIQKDPVTLIKAFSRLKNVADLYLVFVGDGGLRKESELLAKKLGMAERVLFLGIREDVPEIIKASCICVLSSHWEGFGLVAAEYMASGRPVIVSDVPGLRDIVSGAGLLFKPGDENDLAEKISNLLDNPELYKEVVLACLKRVKKYDINRMAELYITVYKEFAIN
jgi:glycosyltransferase involved in cell wall biosynthesis